MDLDDTWKAINKMNKSEDIDIVIEIQFPVMHICIAQM